MSPKSPHPMDRQVGRRIRMRRLLVGLSQEQLAAALGITFQQVQKYEKGTNRVSASRLHQIAGALGIPARFFFEGADDEGRGEATSGSRLEDLVADRDSAALLQSFGAIGDPRVRSALLELQSALARALNGPRFRDCEPEILAGPEVPGHSR
jgi:transcriptional regulator with XRE-family HTH domain